MTKSTPTSKKKKKNTQSKDAKYGPASLECEVLEERLLADVLQNEVRVSLCCLSRDLVRRDDDPIIIDYGTCHTCGQW